MIIRPAEIGDAETLYGFVLRLDREGAPNATGAPIMTAAEVRTAGFGPDPLFEAFIAEGDNSAPLGAASFFRGYSGWHAGSIAVVHMLFVIPEARGSGIGRALLSAVAGLAIRRGWQRLDLLVDDHNPATGFYQTIGMDDTGERRYCAEGEALAALATTRR
jgi:GNAT superfamily N-acetyltransferase